MKLIYFLFPIFINTNAKAQLANDTLYIDKMANQVVFIDAPHSKFHDLVFKNLSLDVNECVPSKTDIYKSYNLNSNYSGDWITVKKFKGKYFAYYPSEPFYNTFFKLTDSTILINDFNDGFISFAIDNKKEKKKKMQLELVEREGVRHYLSIRQKSKTIFIVKSSLFTASKLYFVKRQSYYDYSIIVNNCPTNRCQEFNFK